MPLSGSLSSLLLATLAVPPLAAQDRLWPTDRGPTDKVALVIGIDDYEHPGSDGNWEDLDGCVNDSQRVARLLVGRFGFEAEDVLVLNDSEATHANIVRAIDEWLIQRATAGTEVVVWYSGHGSRVPDLSGKKGVEVEDMDSTLVAFDSRREGAELSFDITDDELHSLFRALCQKTQRVTVVTDSCHSGGALRGPAGLKARSTGNGRRGVSPDDLKEFWPSDVPFLEDGDPRRAEPLPYVHIAACSSTEEAQEWVVRDSSGDNQSFGMLSYHLSEALREMQPGTTYAQLIQKVALEVSSRSPRQQVHVEGGSDRVVFDADFGQPLPGFAAVMRPTRKFLEVAAGSMHLLQKGSRLEVRDLAGKVVGYATVTRARAISSYADWEGDRPDIDDAAALRAIEIERPAGGDPLVVYVAAGSENDALAKALETAYPHSVRIVRSSGESATHQLFVPEGQDAFEFWTTADRLLLHREDPDWDSDRVGALTRAMQRVIERELRHQQLLALVRAAGTVPLAIEFAPASADEADTLQEDTGAPHQPALMHRSASRGLASSAEGGLVLVDEAGGDIHDLVNLTIQIGGSEEDGEVYVSVLCISEDRTVWPIHPVPGARDNRHPAGSELKIPIRVFANEGWSLDRPMRDRYLVIVTERYADFSSFVNRDGGLRDPSEVQTRGGSDSQLPPLLEQALRGAVTRGGMMAVKKKERFGVGVSDVFIERAD